MKEKHGYSTIAANQPNINISRVLISGIITGLILFIGSGIVNGAILSQDFQKWSAEMGTLIHPLKFSLSMILWLIMSVLQGVICMGIYASISGNYGKGLKSVLATVLLLWIVSKLAVAIDLTALGVLTPKIVAGQLIGSFFVLLLGIYAGSRFYKMKKVQ